MDFVDDIWPSEAEATKGFEVKDVLNPAWKDFVRGHRITVRRDRLIPREAKVFTIGSLAVEFRRALRLAGCDVYPKYLEIKFDRKVHAPGGLPKRDNLNHYDTFVIRQEVERAVARRSVDPSSFWRLSASPQRRLDHWAEVWQNPLHRQVYARSCNELVLLSQQLDRCIDDGLADADIVIITLCLTECWRSRATGQYVCLAPTSEADETAPWLEFHPSGFVENLDNVRATIDCIWRMWPSKKIVLTVSPAALARTWTDQDVVVANSASKATLRAAVAQICSESPAIIYWPSYEYATAHIALNPDGRHVAPNAAEAIMSAFMTTPVPSQS